MRYVSSPAHFRLVPAIHRPIPCLTCISSNIKKRKHTRGSRCDASWAPPALHHVALLDGCNMGVVMVQVCRWLPSSTSRPIVSFNIFYERNKKKKIRKDIPGLEMRRVSSPCFLPCHLLTFPPPCSLFMSMPALWGSRHNTTVVVLSVKIEIVNKIIKKKRRLT